MTEPLDGISQRLETLKKTAPNGEYYWMARDIQGVLGYEKWENFENVIKKGIQAAQGTGVESKYHFLDTRKLIEAGKGAKIERSDWFLTRYACYLIAMNGDPTKPEVAASQSYFAIQTRRQELADLSIIDYDSERIQLRDRVRINNRTLAGVAKDAGVQRYQIFNNEGYRGLYGMGISEIKKRKSIPEKESILDFAGRAELAAHDFRITQAEEKLKREHIKSEMRANEAHRQVGVEVREAIRRMGGKMPEDLPKEEHIKKVISAKKKAERLKNSKNQKKLL